MKVTDRSGSSQPDSSHRIQVPVGRQTGNYPETLVLYRMRPVVSCRSIPGGVRGVRYSCLKEAAGEEALMQIPPWGRHTWDRAKVGSAA